MDFKETITNGCYCLNMKGDTKTAIIEEMVDLLISAGRITDRETVLRAVMEREQKMSTGVRHGVAIPHGKTPVVDELVTAVCLKREGVDFEALDNEPSRIFVMTISSVLDTGPHMKYLAQISRLLNVPSVRTRILAVTTNEELISILAED
ncbi:MAG: mannitol/fructose-specific phosphotransferase system IIA component (Ntr-type) [Candidatus Promineifilaceae bacterium]|jgi:mannitol/fructose-specific phosphotransferase system IIA component (Ntr-type)